MGMMKAQRSHASSSSLLLGLSVSGVMLTGLSCSSPSEDGSDAMIPVFSGVPGASTPGAGTPGGAPPAMDPGQPAAPPATSAPPTGVVPEGQNGGAPLDPGTAAGTAGGTPAGQGMQPAAPVDPAAPEDPAAPVDPAAPTETPAPASFFTSGTWGGSVIAATRGTGSTVSPTSFDAHVPGAPFCVSGTVARAAEADAGLVFNLAQEVTANGPGTPAAVAPTGNGVAVTFSRTTGAALRIELNGPDGAWCAELVEVQGQEFVPYNQFSTTCWQPFAPGVAYARQPVTSLNFEVPGRATQALEYGFCVAGFADASGIGEAPPVPANFIEPELSGVISENFGRAIVTGGDGHKYLISNNAWGPGLPEGVQVIDYSNNSFTILQQNAGGQGSQVVTFPFISVGRNGYPGANFSQTTTIDDDLPIQVSQIQSIPTRFSHNVGQGGIQGSDFNATYDVWFAPQPPTGEYGTSGGAFLMVWTHIPQGRVPIGQVVAENVMLEGRAFRLFVGRRDEGLAATGTDGASPVISYVANGTINDYEFDLNVFIQDAVRRAQTGGLRGLQFGTNLFLTDIFAGFEIWNGGAGLRLNEFTADVVPR